VNQRVWIVAHRQKDKNTPFGYANAFWPTLKEARRVQLHLNELLQQHPDETGYGVFPVDLEVLPEEKE
jgi:hypothetical protein